MAVIVLNNAPTISFSRDPIAVKLQTNTSLATVNLKIILQLWVETSYKSGTYTNVHNQKLPPDSSGNATFYIESILDTYFTEDVFPTGFNYNIPVEALKNSKRYYYKYAEESGDPVVIGSYTQSAGKFVINGGVSFEAFPNLGFFTNYVPLTKNFLTWALKPKKVTTTQQEYLYFLFYYEILTDPYDVNFYIKAYFSDGTNTTVYRTFVHNAFEKWDIYIFPAGYYQLDIVNINPAKTVVKYDVWLDDGAVISEVRTYEVQTKYYSTIRTFLYGNSLSGVDTLMTTGNASTKADISKSIANMFKPFDYSVKNGTRKTVNEREVISVTVATGFKTQQEVDRLREILLSQTVKECLTGMWLPIIIKEYNTKIYQDNDDLFYLAFTYERAYDNVSYTPPPDELGLEAGDFNVDFGDDFFINHLP